MAVVTHNFPYKGLSIDVSSGDAKNHAFIKYAEEGVDREYLIEGVKTSKTRQEVIIFYLKHFKDDAGNILNQDIEQQLSLTSQISTEELYNSPAAHVGEKRDQLSINGLLMLLKGVQCFSNEDDTFYPPITADIESTPCTFTLVTPERDEFGITPPPYHQSNDDGTITVTPVDILGVPTFTIVETEATNAEGIFTDLPTGKYTILVESDGSEMPFRVNVEVGSTYL
jgi:hypothetical protein